MSKGIEVLRSLFYGKMLKNEIRKNKTYIEMSELLASEDIIVVDVKCDRQKKYTNVSMTVMKKGAEVTVDDCAKVYNIVYPRLSVTLDTRDLNLEVSTPGIQRVFKDFYEFELFTGKRCRWYDSKKSRTYTGIIGETHDSTVDFTDVVCEDDKQKFEKLSVGFDSIYKAKLDYKWEDIQ